MTRRSVRCCVSVGVALMLAPFTLMSAQNSSIDSTHVVTTRTPLVTVDPKSRSFEIVVYNPQQEPATIEITAQYGPLRRVKVPTSGALFEEDSVESARQRVDSIRTDSLGKLWSMVQWIDSIPRVFTIPPRQSQTIRLYIRVPDSLKSGEYSAHLLIATAFRARPLNAPTVKVGETDVDLGTVGLLTWLPENVYPRSAAKIVYVVP